MLQCRSGKRTGKAAVKIAVDMVDEGLIDMRSAIKMVEPQHLDQLLHPQVYIVKSALIANTSADNLTFWTWAQTKFGIG
jgi:phosphoenolpyruvate synthase/pyruvate phosphate dikinase